MKPRNKPIALAYSKGSSMGDYRVYTLDGAGKTTGPPYVVRCEDDDAALILAQRFADDNIREIWEGARRVATISAIGNDPVHRIE